MFHRIYEAMALGMHPASLYPRRNRVAPKDEVCADRTWTREETNRFYGVGEMSSSDSPR